MKIVSTHALRLVHSYKPSDTGFTTLIPEADEVVELKPGVEVSLDPKFADTLQYKSAVKSGWISQVPDVIAPTATIAGASDEVLVDELERRLVDDSQVRARFIAAIDDKDLLAELGKRGVVPTVDLASVEIEDLWKEIDSRSPDEKNRVSGSPREVMEAADAKKKADAGKAEAGTSGAPAATATPAPAAPATPSAPGASTAVVAGAVKPKAPKPPTT